MKTKEKISWTDDRIALLKRMWKEGKSAAEIAKAVGKGVTRNAVIGKAHRMGLSGRPSPIKKDAEPQAKKPAAAAPVRKPVATKPVVKPAAPAPLRKPAPPPVRGKTPFQPEEPPKFEKEAVPPGGGVALIDLTERMCKWPIGDPREDDFTFCGLAIRVGTPYCPQHAAAAYQTSSRRTIITTTTAPEEKDDVEEAAADPEETAEDEEEDEVETAV